MFPKSKLSPFIGDGGLYQTNKKAFVDSTLGANKHIDWVQRLFDRNAPVIKTNTLPGKDGEGNAYSSYPPNEISTHLMGDDGRGYVFPRIQRINGKLHYFQSEDDAQDYAKKTNTGIQFKTPEQGSWFAANGYKTGTGVNNSSNQQGIPFNNPNYTAH